MQTDTHGPGLLNARNSLTVVSEVPVVLSAGCLNVQFELPDPGTTLLSLALISICWPFELVLTLIEFKPKGVWEMQVFDLQLWQFGQVFKVGFGVRRGLAVFST